MACVKSTGAARCTFVGGYVDDCCFFPLLLWVGSAWGYEWHLVPGTIFDSVEASGEVCRNFFTAGFLVSGIPFEDMLRTTPSPPPPSHASLRDPVSFTPPLLPPPAVYRSDTLVPYAAMKWLERALPLCASSVIPGGTHAFVYDKPNMEEVFSTLQKSIKEARVSLETKEKKHKKRNRNRTRRGRRRLFVCLLSVLPKRAWRGPGLS